MTKAQAFKNIARHMESTSRSAAVACMSFNTIAKISRNSNGTKLLNGNTGITKFLKGKLNGLFW